MSKKKQKSRYQVKNWREYNASLIERGSLTIWITPEVLEQWNDSRPAQRGGQYQYSDMAIEALLTLKHLLKLPYRATQGFARSLFGLLEIEVEVPDYTTLNRRAKTLSVQLHEGQEPVHHLVLDSSGLKVYGEGEWKVRQHGASKRRTWRKLHLSVDPETHQIVTELLTKNNVDDAEAGVAMLRSIDDPLDSLSADGAYDKRKFYDQCIEQEIGGVNVPPRKDAKIWQHGNSNAPPHPRDENLRYIRRHGRKKWKQDARYHQRSLAETAVFRFKSIFGSALNARSDGRQQTETTIKCSILNRFTSLGMPETIVVPAA